VNFTKIIKYFYFYFSHFLRSCVNFGCQILPEDEEKLKLLEQFNADWEMLLEGKYAQMPQWNYF